MTRARTPDPDQHGRNILRCQACPDRRSSHCGQDGQDIALHARDNYCPTGRYRLGLGDRLASWLSRTGLRWLALELSRERELYVWWRESPRSCGCPARQVALNGRRVSGS